MILWPEPRHWPQREPERQREPEEHGEAGDPGGIGESTRRGAREGVKRTDKQVEEERGERGRAGAEP